MIALFSLLIIIVLSIIGVRIGAIALELTGLSPEIASFQAQSAFSGAGFTTSEAEAMVNHPVRRRIIRILILFGGAGVSTSIATLVLTFVGETGRTVLLKGFILIEGLLIIFLFAQSKFIYRIMKKLISNALEKWTKMRVFDYEQLLGFGEGYTISRVAVKNNSWLSHRRLIDLKLEQKGVLVLAIYRKVGKRERFIGSLSGDTVIVPHDVLICYSHKDVSEIFR
jgi:hypothetical protein